MPPGKENMKPVEVRKRTRASPLVEIALFSAGSRSLTKSDVVDSELVLVAIFC